MSIELIKSIELVPKRNAFKARSYNNAVLKKWVDFGSVREHFSYAFGVIPLDCNSFLKTLFIQVAKFVSPSFAASSSSCCLNSSVNRIWYCGDLFPFGVDMVLTLYYYNYMVTTIIMATTKKAIPRSGGTLSRDLTTITLTEVMIMANRYDSAHLRARQSKLYKFYDLSTAQVIQTTATTERQARKNLGKQSLIFIARIRITPIIEQAGTWGGYSHE